MNRIVTIDKDSWQAGWEAGYAGKPNSCPTSMDSYSWSSGYVEGKARRAR